MHKAISIFKSQGLMWLGDLYTAFRLIITTVILAAVGLSGWASATQGEFVTPVEVLVNPEMVVSTLVDTVIHASFPDVTICDPQGECFTLTFEE